MDPKVTRIPTQISIINSPKNTKRFILLGTVLVIILCCCVIALTVGGYLLTTRGDDLFPSNKPPGIYLNSEETPGTIAGVYRGKGKDVSFSVSTEGIAVFTANSDGEESELIVDYSNIPIATMQWKDFTFDGLGPLTPEESEALAELAKTDEFRKIALTALDISCRIDVDLTPVQVAALLFPLQMHLKYNDPQRSYFINELITVSSCDYSGRFKNEEEATPIIYLTAANLFPVVIGYFPFDAEGAVEQNSTGNKGGKVACFNNYTLSVQAGDNAKTFLLKGLSDLVPIVNEYGPCNAMCRGACGPDCTLNNCTVTTGTRCETDEDGLTTGWYSQVNHYDCGLHPACIKHDECYDTCNKVHGCNTYAAAYCRHGGYHITSNSTQSWLDAGLGFSFCDWTTLAEEQTINVVRWVKGFGPQPVRQEYEYPDKEYGTRYDAELCSPGIQRGEKPTPDDKKDKPQNPIGKSPYDPIDPCLFAPPDGTILDQGINYCNLRYDTTAPVRLVFIHAEEERFDMESACKKDSGHFYGKVVEEIIVGECGYKIEHNMGFPVSWNFSEGYAWGINFLYDKFEVKIIQEGFPDDNDGWVQATAEYIDKQIGLYLTQVGN